MLKVHSRLSIASIRRRLVIFAVSLQGFGLTLGARDYPFSSILDFSFNPWPALAGVAALSLLVWAVYITNFWAAIFAALTTLGFFSGRIATVIWLTGTPLTQSLPILMGNVLIMLLIFDGLDHWSAHVVAPRRIRITPWSQN